jgi:hypothetical protein
LETTICYVEQLTSNRKISLIFRRGNDIFSLDSHWKAHNYFKELNESGPKNGFSVQVFVEGKGRNSFCNISKNRNYHKIVLKVMKQLYGKLKDVKKCVSKLLKEHIDMNRTELRKW